jgi:molybdopterin-guanine dinucleotide biosynthesis protein A
MLSAIILAGGRSSRMGTPKALLLFDGEPLILHIVRLLRPMFDEVVVVAAPGQLLPELPARIVHDDVAYQGPVGGICYGLQAAAGEYGLVTSCDSAFLNQGLISYLLTLRHDYDVVCPHWEDRYQPLLAVYSRTVVPFLQAQLANGELRPVHLFDKVRTRRVAEDEIRRFDPAGDSFFNMNRPEDYAEALRRWRVSDPTVRSGGAGDPVSCIVELFGVAQLLAKAREIPLTLPPGATLAHLYNALAASMPILAGRVVAASGGGLLDGYACNVNGLHFVRGVEARINSGDRIAIMSADAGG